VPCSLRKERPRLLEKVKIMAPRGGTLKFKREGRKRGTSLWGAMISFQGGKENLSTGGGGGVDYLMIAGERI